MSDRPETFEVFLHKWKNERIQPLGSRGMESDERDHVIAERAGELVTLSASEVPMQISPTSPDHLMASRISCAI